jgi:hypothetical protein
VSSLPPSRTEQELSPCDRSIGGHDGRHPPCRRTHRTVALAASVVKTSTGLGLVWRVEDGVRMHSLSGCGLQRVMALVKGIEWSSSVGEGIHDVESVWAAVRMMLVTGDFLMATDRQPPARRLGLQIQIGEHETCMVRARRIAEQELARATPL